MTAPPDEVSGAQTADGADPPAPTPRPVAAGGPRAWLHRIRRATQPTPADLDPDAVNAGPRSDVTLAHRSPFAIGFFITLGALTAFGLVFGLYRISSVVVLVMLALYLALGLNPLVDKLSARGLRRGSAVFLVALGALAVLSLAFWAAMLDLAPASRRPRVRYLANEVFGRIGGYVTGLFIVITCAATVAFVFLSIVGLGQYALALAVVVALCAIIPLIGSTLSMIIVSIVAFTFSATQGFITLAFFLTYQQVDNYFIQPRVFQRSVSVPGPLVILAAVCGGVLYGLLGALLAIPSMAALMLLYQEVLIPALNRR